MSPEQERADAVATLLLEAQELLEAVEAGLLDLAEDGGSDPDVVTAVLTAVHLVERSAGLVGLDVVGDFAHGVVGVLDRVRASGTGVEVELVEVLLSCKDHLAALLDVVADGDDASDPALRQRGDSLLLSLEPFVQGGPVALAGADHDADAEYDGEPVVRMHVSLRLRSDGPSTDAAPMSFLRHLSTMGEVLAVVTMHELLPEAGVTVAGVRYLAFEVTLDTVATVEAVLDVLEPFHGNGDIRVLTRTSPAEEVADLVASYGDLGPVVTELLRCSGIHRDGEDAVQTVAWATTVALGPGDRASGSWGPRAPG